MAERKTGLPVDPTSPPIAQIISPFVPMSYQVDRPYSVNTQEVDGGLIYSETPQKVSDPQFAVPPVITGGIEFFKQFLDDPTETAGGIATAIGEEIKAYPERQVRTALAGGETINPETGEIERYDPLGVPATTALGSAASIARTAGDGGTVLGIMAGRNAKSGQEKFDDAFELLREGKKDKEIFDETKSFFDLDVFGNERDAFRFEIPTTGVTLKEGLVSDGKLQGKVRNVERAEDEYGSYLGYTSTNDDPYVNLEELLDFPELYEQYPQLRELKVANVEGHGGAFYDPAKDFIGMGTRRDNKTFLSALLHEVQHKVQRIEGFPTGANPEAIAIGLADRMETASPEPFRNLSKELYRSVYGETEPVAVQRRFENPEKATESPLKTRREVTPDDNISISQADAVDRGEEALIDALEYGDISYSDLYNLQSPFSSSTGRPPVEKGSVFVYPSEKIARKAEGGVVSLLDTAQNMNRGPKGVASLSSVARNMNRPMVS